ncbi:MAG: hypothetical protein EOM67_13750 [Spirochaetia bacterium]|nr:hypothetical protein [Spirochaetia bacterium]
MYDFDRKGQWVEKVEKITRAKKKEYFSIEVGSNYYLIRNEFPRTIGFVMILSKDHNFEIPTHIKIKYFDLDTKTIHEMNDPKLFKTKKEALNMLRSMIKKSINNSTKELEKVEKELEITNETN